MLLIGRNSCKRRNPNRHSVLSRTVNVESEKSGRSIKITDNSQSTEKKRLHRDFAEHPDVVPRKKQFFIKTEREKVCVSPSNECQPQSMDFEKKNIFNGCNAGDKVGGSDEIDDGRSDESLEYDQNGEYCCDIKSKGLLQNSNCKHLPSKIPSGEKKKWPQKPCVDCGKYGVRRDTRYICSSCDVALCNSACFSRYHDCK